MSRRNAAQFWPSSCPSWAPRSLSLSKIARRSLDCPGCRQRANHSILCCLSPKLTRSKKQKATYFSSVAISCFFNQSFVIHISPNVISTKKQNPLLYCHYHPSPTPTKVVADTDMILNVLSITYDPVCISRYALYFCTFLNALSEMRCVVSEDLMHGMLSKFNKTYNQNYNKYRQLSL